MQAIAFPQLRWTLFPLLTGSILLPLRSAAQQPERYTVSEGEIAIYNLAGEVRVSLGRGLT